MKLLRYTFLGGDFVAGEMVWWQGDRIPEEGDQGFPPPHPSLLRDLSVTDKPNLMILRWITSCCAGNEPESGITRASGRLGASPSLCP